MATVAVALALTRGAGNVFERPPTPVVGNVPYGEIVFTGSISIPALGAGDTTIITMSGTLPEGWVYRPVEVHVNIFASVVADLAGAEEAMLLTLTENQVSVKSFQLFNQNIFYTNDAGSAEFNPAVTNDFVASFTPMPGDVPGGAYPDLLDASQGISIVQIVWVDRTATSSAYTGDVYLRFLYWTIEQARQGRLWQPTYTLT